MKKILICDSNLHELGHLTTWVHERYIHTMATNLERAHYQFRSQVFDLVIADVSDNEVWEWLTFLEETGQLVLYLSDPMVNGPLHLTKPPMKEFESFREPFLQKVTELLGE